jgi:hypothetical protein
MLRTIVHPEMHYSNDSQFQRAFEVGSEGREFQLFMRPPHGSYHELSVSFRGRKRDVRQI